MFEKKSKFWLAVGGFVFAMVFGSIFLVFLLNFDSSPTFENISGFIALATMVSAIVCAPGYLGYKKFSFITFFANIIGLLTMLIVAFQDSQTSSNPLASVLTYIIVLVVGFVGAFITELLSNKTK